LISAPSVLLTYRIDLHLLSTGWELTLDFSLFHLLGHAALFKGFGHCVVVGPALMPKETRRVMMKVAPEVMDLRRQRLM
jgi:hypothetical protein